PADGYGGLNFNASMDAANPNIASYLDTPYVAWNENAGIAQYVFVKYYDGSSWQSLGGSLNVNGTRNASFPDIEIANGTPYVCWRESDGVANQIYVKRHNGLDWEPLGGSLNIQGNREASYPAITVFQGDPCVIWQESNGTYEQLHVKQYHQGGWAHIGNVLNTNASQNATMPDIFAGQENLYVTWQESVAASSRVYVKKYLPVTPTPTCTVTFTATSTATCSRTYTATSTRTPTASPTCSETLTATVTFSATESPTGTPTPSISPTVTMTKTITVTLTATASPSQTGSATITLTITVSPTQTKTATISPTPLAIPKDQILCYPMPATGDQVWFYYWMNGPGVMEIDIYNLVGEKGATLSFQHTESGYMKSAWDIRQVANGVYFYRGRCRDDSGSRIYPVKKIAIVK
ncbi:hypothetical protein JW933_03140, partial [candidate division FCPU426 bacterium]|nr:hypothetical protein [candidate division FCPU426 bacterium]